MNKTVEQLRQERLGAINEELKDVKLKLAPPEFVEGVECLDVVEADIPEIKEQIKEMEKIVKAHSGLGLAAPQVGIAKKFYIAFIDGQYELFCNAKFFRGNASRNSHLEGCLTYPLLDHTMTKRWKEVVVHYDMIVNDKLVPMKKKFRGVEAFEHQHEIDHLNGETIYAK